MTGEVSHTLILGKSNSYGLTRDAEILRNALAQAGTGSEFATLDQRTWWERLTGAKRANRIVHLERAHPGWFRAASETWLIPNQERFPRRQIGRLKHVDRVLAKSRHAEAIFRGLGVETVYLGFSSPDRRMSGVSKDFNRFFHLAGGSTLKGTEDVLAAWERHPEWPELFLIQKQANTPQKVPPNVNLVSGYMDDRALQVLQNGCGVHLCPSRSEGWGHHILEGLSTGSVVVTTGAAPMNEHVDASCGVLVPFARSEPRHLGTNYFVDAAAFDAVIEQIIAMPDAQKQGLGLAARRRFEDIDTRFTERVAEIFG